MKMEGDRSWCNLLERSRGERFCFSVMATETLRTRQRKSVDLVAEAAKTIRDPAPLMMGREDYISASVSTLAPSISRLAS
jgi:hypothetical protein